MTDTIGTPRPAPTLTIALRIRRLVDTTGTAAIDVARIESDVAIANTIWNPFGFEFVTASIEDWVSDEYFDIADGDHFQELSSVHWRYGQTWVNVYYIESWTGGVAGACSFPNHAKAHAIALEDDPGLSPTEVDDWRGIALAHELGHYFDLAHTPVDTLPDTDSSGTGDPGNMMTQGGGGRTTVVADIHITEGQVERARNACFSERANLIAPLLCAAVG